MLLVEGQSKMATPARLSLRRLASMTKIEVRQFSSFCRREEAAAAAAAAATRKASLVQSAFEPL